MTHRKIGFLEQVVDHSLKSKCTAIIRRINTGNAIAVQFFYFVRQDYTTTAAKI